MQNLKLKKSHSNKRGVFALCVSFLSGVVTTLGPGALMWRFLHPISFWQRAFCAGGAVALAAALFVPALFIGGILFAILED